MTDEEARAFYASTAWRHKRDEILKRDHYECLLCKEGKGYAHKPMHTRAVLVHHVNHLKDRPDLALSDTYVDANGETKRQLISVCKACHEVVCHPERRGLSRGYHHHEPVTRERWD